MNYRELAGLAHYHTWAEKMKRPIDAHNKDILARRQRFLDERKEIGVGDFVIVGENLHRVAHHWGDSIQLTSGSSGSFYLGDTYVDYSGGLEPGIPIARFEATEERRFGSVWFFSENIRMAHNGFDTLANFRVWRLNPEPAPFDVADFFPRP